MNKNALEREKAAQVQVQPQAEPSADEAEKARKAEAAAALMRLYSPYGSGALGRPADPGGRAEAGGTRARTGSACHAVRRRARRAGTCRCGACADRGRRPVRRPDPAGARTRT
ncbi:MAG: hypothetical protein WDN06_14110 [Asticcacaulis sp.]